MKYSVDFTLPMLCNFIVEADSLEDAYKIVSKKKFKEVYKNSLDFQIIDDRIDEDDICEVNNVSLYDEEV